MGEVFLEEVPLEGGVTVPDDLGDLEALLGTLDAGLDLDLDPDLYLFFWSPHQMMTTIPSPNLIVSLKGPKSVQINYPLCLMEVCHDQTGSVARVTWQLCG